MFVFTLICDRIVLERHFSGPNYTQLNTSQKETGPYANILQAKKTNEFDVFHKLKIRTTIN